MTPTSAKQLDSNPAFIAWKNGAQIQQNLLPSFGGNWHDVTDIDIELWGRQPDLFRVKPVAFSAPPDGEEWHNPEKLTPAQIGNAPWRLRLKGELKQNADEYWENGDVWKGVCGGSKLYENITYRTREPLPVKLEPLPVCPFKVGQTLIDSRDSKIGTVHSIRADGNPVIQTRDGEFKWGFIPRDEWHFWTLYTPKLVKLGCEDVPPGSAVQASNHSVAWSMVVQVFIDSIATNDEIITFHELQKSWLINRNGEKDALGNLLWSKCEKEEMK